MPTQKIYYSGRVQGVGFRYTVKELAKGFDVIGWVRNLPDGRVELTAQAETKAELTAFLDELEKQSAMAHNIREIERHPAAPLEGVAGFSILR